MAKLLIEDEYVDIRTSWLEWLEHRGKPRRVPLLHIRDVHCASASTNAAHARGRNSASVEPPHLLELDLFEEDVDRLIVDVEDEAPDLVADRIRYAVASAQARAIEGMRTRSEHRELPPLPLSEPPPPPDPFASELEPVFSVSPLPRTYSQPPPATIGEETRLAHVGGWLLGFGLFGLLTGAIIIAGGAAPGLLVMGAGITTGGLGALALIVSSHQRRG
jgi:hypothetical protein